MLKNPLLVENLNNLYLYNEIERYIFMMNNRPLILITNDDGIQAKGINELAACLRDFGDIVVFAPDGRGQIGDVPGPHLVGGCGSM